MKRTKLRFLFAPLWIINMIFQFGLLYGVLPKENGELNIRIMALITLPFLFSIYLIKDILQFKRPLFLRIIGYWSLFYSIVYLFLIIYLFSFLSIIYLLLFIPTLLTGIYLIKSTK